MTQHSYRTGRPLTAAVIAATLATGWLTAVAPASASTTGAAASVAATTGAAASVAAATGGAATGAAAGVAAAGVAADGSAGTGGGSAGTGGPLACASPPAPGMTACQLAVAPRTGPADGVKAGAAKSGAGQSAAAQSGAAQPAQATGPVGYSPAQLQQAYQFQSASEGTRITVAVVAPYDDPDVASDLAAYRTQYGLPACPQTLATSAPACFTEISESGALITSGSGTAPAANASWALQTSAQVDAVSAICPNCNITLVEVNSPAITDIGAGVNFAADLGTQVITIGDAEPEANSDPTWDTAYFDQSGIAITAAAGNGGYSTTGVDYPAASPDVTAVGGTTLTPSGTGTCTAALAGTRGWCEQAWNDANGASTSACSLFETEPSWQKSGLPAGDTGCGSLRTVADVSADADPATGIAVYDSYSEGGWQPTPMGGTSVAAAIVAGAYALAGLPASGTFPASYPYGHATGLNDVTTGNNNTTANPTCSPAYLCTAGTGYDGPTGLGTPAYLTAFSHSGTFTGEIFNGVLGKCLDDNGGKTTNGNKVDLYGCNDNSASQIWTVEANGTIQIQGHCLDDSKSGTANDNPVDLWTCNNTPAQVWLPQSDGALLNPLSGRCLGVTNGDTADGTQLWIYNCDGQDTQDWTMPYPVPSSGPGEINSGVTGKCVDDYQSGTANKTKVDIFTCNNNGTSQQWTVENDGTIQINSKCMDVTSSGTTAGTLVDLFTCNGTGAQQWRAEPDGALLNPESGLCLDAPGTANNTQLVIDPCNQTTAQQWTLPPLS
jgi:hypothetical protein